jgi:ABC-type polysaccharide/polyol phosphate export permease
LNPLYHILTMVREPLMGKAPAAIHWIVVTAIAVFGWALTIQMMSKLRHRIVYWL